jgi:hypothetical protein
VRPLLGDVENAEGAPIGWQLQNGEDGSPVGLDVNLIFTTTDEMRAGQDC